jgi:hypothetical protein
VRRVWVTLLVGLFGLVLGLIIGFAVSLWKRTSDPAWLEAVGTWVGAGVTMLAVILAVIVFFSEDFARRREDRRKFEAAEHARQAERAQLQQQADQVVCDARYSTSSEIGRSGFTNVIQMEVEVTNASDYPVRYVTCRIPQIGDEPIKLWDLLQSPDRQRRAIDVPKPFLVHEDHREIRESAEFTFSLGGVTWVGRYAQPAERLDP